jgi:hypothetical protein
MIEYMRQEPPDETHGDCDHSECDLCGYDICHVDDGEPLVYRDTIICNQCLMAIAECIR